MVCYKEYIFSKCSTASSSKLSRLLKLCFLKKSVRTINSTLLQELELMNSSEFRTPFRDCCSWTPTCLLTSAMQSGFPAALLPLLLTEELYLHCVGKIHFSSSAEQWELLLYAFKSHLVSALFLKVKLLHINCSQSSCVLWPLCQLLISLIHYLPVILPWHAKLTLR